MLGSGIPAYTLFSFFFSYRGIKIRDSIPLQLSSLVSSPAAGPPSSPNSPIRRPSPRLHVIAVNARGALVRYRGVIAASFEVDVFEVEGVDVAWDDTGEREVVG